MGWKQIGTCAAGWLLVGGASAQSFPEAFIAEVEKRWESIEGRSIGAWVWRDKNRLTDVYSDLRQRLAPNAVDESSALDALRTLARKRRRDEHFTWRAQELISDMLWEAGDPRGAHEALVAALDAYPDERYPDPAKHSSFQHLANRLAGRTWLDEGPAAAEDEILARFVEDGRFQHFRIEWWQERYRAEAQEERLPALIERVVQGYRSKEKRDRRQAELYAGYRARVEAAMPRAPISAGGDPRRAYFLLTPDGHREGDRTDLVLVLPGGTGQAADFLPWLTRLHADVGGERAFAVLSAPQWSDAQKERVVWVKEADRERFPEAGFGTEDFIASVLRDVRARGSVVPERVFLFGWSSSGPALYAAALGEGARYDGALIQSSVFKAAQLDLAKAAGRRFYLRQGRSDTITALRWAEEARTALRGHGAQVHLETFAGGHGFASDDPASGVREGLRWLASSAKR